MVHIHRIHKDNGYPQFDYTIEKVMSEPDFNRKDVSKFIGTRVYTPKAGDKIFFVSGCDVPRFKVKQLCQKYDIALVKFQDKADVKFIGPQVVHDLFTSHYENLLSKSYLLDYLHQVLGDTDVRYMSFINDIKNSGATTVAMHYSPLAELKDKTWFQLKLFRGNNADRTEGGMLNHHSYLKLVDIAAYNQFMDLCTDNKYYNQDDIMKIINSGTVMTEELREQTRRLFESTDVGNHRVAMEAMANCDYEASAVPLLLLMKDFGQTMYSCNTKNHVNFKALLKFFNVRDLQHVNFDDIIASLRYQKILNTSNLKMLIPDVKDDMSSRAQSGSFDITEIAIKEDIKSEVIVDGVDAEMVEEESSDEINPTLGV